MWCHLTRNLDFTYVLNKLMWLPSVLSTNIYMAPVFITVHEFNRATTLSTWSHHFTVALARYNLHLYSNTFFSWTSHLRNSFSISCFPLTYKLRKYKCIIDHYFRFWEPHFVVVLFSPLVNNVFSFTFYPLIHCVLMTLLLYLGETVTVLDL